MPDREKVIENLERMLSNYDLLDSIVINRNNEMLMFHRAVAKSALELLKEQDKLKQKWLRNIADNQLAHAPNDSHEFMTLDEHLENEYKRGIWDGLQIAYEILTEEV